MITYDMVAEDIEISPSSDRVTVLRRLTDLHLKAIDENDELLANAIAGRAALLRALLGERLELEPYIAVSQGCQANGWPAAYVQWRGDIARQRLAELGISWGGDTDSQLEEIEGLLDWESVPERVLHEATTYERLVRHLAGSEAPYTVSVERVNLGAYWSYWLDGKGGAGRLRFNDRRNRMTEVRIRQFALHEILGHALQGAAWSLQCSTHDVPWIRVLTLTGLTHVAFEGVGQALPLLLAIDDPILEARVRLEHYVQLVRSDLHLMVNRGDSISDCVDHASRMVPFWRNERIGDFLSDRAVDPTLRSYLWTYPAGFDWFVALSETNNRELIRRVVSATYETPLTPADLKALWPSGPSIGGA